MLSIATIVVVVIAVVLCTAVMAALIVGKRHDIPDDFDWG